MFGAAKARQARARDAEPAGAEANRQARLFAAARGHRPKEPEHHPGTQGAGRPPDPSAGPSRPRSRRPGYGPAEAPPPPRPPSPQAVTGGRRRPPPVAETAVRSRRPVAAGNDTPDHRPPAPGAGAAVAPRVGPERGPGPADASPPRAAARGPSQAAARPRPRPATVDGGQPTGRVEADPARARRRPSAATIAAGPDADDQAPEQALAPARRRRPPPRGSRRPPGETGEKGGRRPFLARHFVPPSALGAVVIALLIAVVTGVTAAYVWAGSDDGRLRQSAPTPPSSVARAQDAPPPEETTSTTRPDLEPDAVARKLGPSVWTVNTLNSAGQPVQGSAFVVGSSGAQGLLLTSLAVVEASTQRPAPDITVVGAGYNGAAALWTWDEGRDLALLVVDRAAPAPAWAADSARLAPGDRVFAVGRGGKVSAGVVTGITPGAVQHNVFVDDVLRGGPLVNAKGDVVAMASAAYTAGGKPTDTAFFGVPIQTVCGGVLRCGGSSAPPGTEPGVGATSTTRRPPAATRPG